MSDPMKGSVPCGYYREGQSVIDATCATVPHSAVALQSMPGRYAYICEELVIQSRAAGFFLRFLPEQDEALRIMSSAQGDPR